MFFNISKEKQETFINAALEEFTTNSFTKRAGIARGSFYNYFHDLESLFNYLIRFTKKERLSYAKVLIEKVNGDIFEFVRQLFLYDYDAFSKTNKYSLFRNYIHYIQNYKKGSLKDYLIMATFDQEDDSLFNVFSAFDLNGYNLTKEDLVDLIEVMILLMINTFLKSESENLTKEQVINLFNKRVSFFEYGIKKEN